MVKKVSILGSTGSIGRNALDVIASMSGEAVVVGLAAGRNIDLLTEQVRAVRPEVVAVADGADIRTLERRLAGMRVQLLAGQEGTDAVIADAELVISAMVGFAGFAPTLTAARAGKQIALANKESLVAGGRLIKEALAASGAVVFPVDSEHAALAQCLEGKPIAYVKRLVLTASGGPFRCRAPGDVANAKPEEALAHPVWNMGAKISVDSATLMNKGLEVIEAHWLFDMPYERIDVLVHPQSVVHSLVEWADGSYLAQLAPADMRLPIQYALTYPERRESRCGVAPLAWETASRLDFEPLDNDRFPCFTLAVEAGKKGGVYPAVMNAANETAVGSYLREEIRFGAIPDVIREVLDGTPEGDDRGYEDVVAADAWARRRAEEIARRM